MYRSSLPYNPAMRRVWSVVLILGVGLLSLVLTAPVVTGADESWSTAETAAFSEWKTSEGRSYGKSLEQAFSKDHSATIGACAKETEKPDLSNFTLLLQLDAQGVVASAMVKPATNLAVCLEGKMKGWKSIPPPHAGFWAKLDVKLKSK
jgi:hypothetical protein